MSRDVDVNEIVTNAAEAELAHMLAGLSREELEGVAAKLALALYMAHAECVEAHQKVPPTIAAIIEHADLAEHVAEEVARPSMLSALIAGEEFAAIERAGERLVH